MTKPHWIGQGSRHARGYGYQWTKIRARILARDLYLCQRCLAHDRPTPATDVDHKIPKAKGGTDDDSNLQALCGQCHRDKTADDARQSGAKMRRLDGW